MKLVPVEQTDLTLPELAEMARTETVILTRDGKPLAAVKDLSGSDWESVSLANNPRFLAVIERARRAYQEEGGTDLEELRRELNAASGPSRLGRSRKKK